MYRVYQDQARGWVEIASSNSFSDAWEHAKIIKRQDKKPVKVVGPEGEWEVK